MDPTIEDILILADRMMLHVRHNVPPEVEVMDKLQKMIDQFREEHGIPSPVTQSIPGTT